MRLQGPARRARTGADPGRPRPGGTGTPTCWSGCGTATTPRSCASTADRAWSSPPTSSPRWSTTPYDWGRIAAANALSDVYAMGGQPADRAQPARLAARPAAAASWPRRCCAAARRSAREAGCHLAGGHSIDDPEPKYGLAVTGIGPTRSGCCATTPARAGVPLSLTKPLGRGGAEQPAQGDR